MDYSNVYSVYETEDIDEVNEMIKEHDWLVIGVAPGYKKDGTAYFLYSLGDVRPSFDNGGWAPDPETP